MTVDLRLGDCLEVMRGMVPDSVDSIVTDPPYGLSFMGKDWDHGVPGVPFWQAALAIAKPGAHLLAFGGTRTWHRLAIAIEDAGWEIRDTVMWVYGSGFPKSLDVGKAIDREAGAERTVVGTATHIHSRGANLGFPKLSAALAGESREAAGEWPQVHDFPLTAPATNAARQWQGWGTALKPAWEPIIVARKPLDGTVAANVQRWGTGGLNVDGCRVGTAVETWPASRAYSRYDPAAPSKGTQRTGTPAPGRWPANLLHDGSDEVVALFPDAASGGRQNGGECAGLRGNTFRHPCHNALPADSGSAARFFYCAKASRADRDEGCEGLQLQECGMMEDDAYPIHTGSGNPRETRRRNHHPTVKPTPLMRYLCRLVTPPGGVVLDPFMGSGSTGKAALLEGFGFIGIEVDAGYHAIAERRIAAAQKQLALPLAGAV